MNIVKADVIEPLIVFEPNKGYINQVIEEQLDLMAHNMKYMRLRDLPDDWPSFRFQWKVNDAGVPSEEVVGKARSELFGRIMQKKVSSGLSMM